MTPAPALHGLVLAGGRSRRFGRDKAAVDIGGETLLARTVKLLQPRVAELRVSVRPDQLHDELRAAFPLLPDELGSGPAAGLLAAHGLAPQAAWLVVACDLPALSPALLEQLCRARDPQRAATAFRAAAGGRPEPLCAIYEPATLARFQRQVAAGGEQSPRGLLESLDTLLVEPGDAAALANMNQPDDLEALRSGRPAR